MNQFQVANAIKGSGSVKKFIVKNVAHQLKLDSEQVETAFDCPTKIEFTVGGHSVSCLIEV